MIRVGELIRDPIGVLKAAFKGFQRDDGTGVSAEAAYRLVFALPALVIFFASLSAMAAQYTGVDAFDLLLDRAEEGLPDEVFGTLQMVFETVEEQSGVGVLSIGLVIAMWSGSNAIAAVIKAINLAYGMTDDRGMIEAVCTCWAGAKRYSSASAAMKRIRINGSRTSVQIIENRVPSPNQSAAASPRL